MKQKRIKCAACGKRKVWSKFSGPRSRTALAVYYNSYGTIRFTVAAVTQIICNPCLNELLSKAIKGAE